jgi:hypothetical protein
VTDATGRAAGMPGDGGSAGWGLEWAMTWMAERSENGTENKVLCDWIRVYTSSPNEKELWFA